MIISFLIKKSLDQTERNQNRFFNKTELEEDLEPKRGTWSERDLVSKLSQYGIPNQTIFHDLYLKKYYGKYSQIDLVGNSIL